MMTRAMNRMRRIELKGVDFIMVFSNVKVYGQAIKTSAPMGVWNWPGGQDGLVHRF
jgi:hypothetical protein